MRALTLSILLIFLGASHAWAHPAVPGEAPAAVPSFFAPIQQDPSDWLDRLTATHGALEQSTCGFSTCLTTQICVFCGNSFFCRPPGDTCCYPGFCSAGQSCIFCGNSVSCHPNGSTCCNGTFNLICGPTQRCDSTQHCVPK